MPHIHYVEIRPKTPNAMLKKPPKFKNANHIRRLRPPRIQKSNLNNKGIHPNSLTAPPPRLYLLTTRIPILALGLINHHLDRDAKPTPTIPAHTKTAARSDAVKIAAAHLLFRGPDARRLYSRRELFLNLPILLDQLPGDDAEHLLDALAALSTHLMAAIPADLLAPEAGAAFRARALGADVDGGVGALPLWRALEPRRRCRGRRRREPRREVVRHVGDAPLEGHFAPRGLARYEVRLGPDDVQDDVGGQVAAQLGQPDAHFFEGGKVGDAIAEDASVRAAVVKAGYRAVRE